MKRTFIRTNICDNGNPLFVNMNQVSSLQFCNNYTIIRMANNETFKVSESYEYFAPTIDSMHECGNKPNLCGITQIKPTTLTDQELELISKMKKDKK